MNNLERHITRLLLDNDCVIVPGFGGFMAHHMNAYFNEEDGRFYPPRRTIGFNSQLKMNDSLLAQSYIETYDTSYPEAMGRIEADVEELRQAIETEGEYTINGIGTLRMSDNGVYSFEPCLAGLLTPTLFALDAVEARRTYASKQQNAKEIETATAPYEGLPQDSVKSADTQGLAPADADETKKEPTNTTGKVVKLGDIGNADDANHTFGDAEHLPNNDVVDMEPRQHKVVPMWVRDIAVACLVLAAVLLLPSPTGKQAKSLSGSNIDASLLLKVMPKDLTTGEPESGALKVEAPVGADSINSMVEKADSSEKADAKTAQNENEETNTPKGYTIVLASKVSKAGAERYVSQLHKRGYTDATVTCGSEGSMVTYGCYDNSEQAHAVRNKLTDNIEFADSWILHLK